MTDAGVLDAGRTDAGGTDAGRDVGVFPRPDVVATTDVGAATDSGSLRDAGADADVAEVDLDTPADGCGCRAGGRSTRGAGSLLAALALLAGVMAARRRRS